ncbi:HepT-like ribonuclease domain-containing protein [Pseudonocardia ailaonensis]|uniref:HepT-like ribonuclease domain-containing protein n=1 Tax=Pseudonocardia ailaonensis TaxID=367279 RepID=UPI0031DFB7D0
MSRVAPEIAARVPGLAQIIGFRNILIHGYAVVDDGLVWDAVTAKLPGLRTTLTAPLAEGA